jgi:hypothetical protein
MPAQMQSESNKQPAFPVALVLDYQGSSAITWSAGRWQVIGAVAGQHGASQHRSTMSIRKDEAGEQVLCSGYYLRLHRDDAESYYCNLMGERPSLFVVCREEAGQRPEPTLVTVSYGEAASYSEVDGTVHAIAMPPEIYRWVEAYVLEHYVPEKRKKRKRDDWKKDEQRP